MAVVLSFPGHVLRSDSRGRYTIYARQVYGPESAHSGETYERAVAHSLRLHLALERLLELEVASRDISTLGELREAILTFKAEVATFLTFSPLPK